MGGIAAPDHGQKASLSGLPLLRVVLGERVVQQRPHQAGDELPAPERLIMVMLIRFAPLACGCATA
jgi:hypothetical protein